MSHFNDHGNRDVTSTIVITWPDWSSQSFKVTHNIAYTILATLAKEQDAFMRWDTIVNLQAQNESTTTVLKSIFHAYFPDKLHTLNQSEVERLLNQAVKWGKFEKINIYTALECCLVSHLFDKIAWFSGDTLVLATWKRDTAKIHRSPSIQHISVEKMSEHMQTKIIAQLEKYISIITTVAEFAKQQLNQDAYEKIRIKLEKLYNLAREKLIAIDETLQKDKAELNDLINDPTQTSFVNPHPWSYSAIA